MARAQWTVERCPVCSDGQRSSFVAFDELEFVQCARCAVVYKAREDVGLLPDDFYERGYFQGRKSGRELRFAHRVRKAAAWIRDALACLDGRRHLNARLLDVGCSLGYVIEGARQLGLSGTGVDLSSYAVQVCQDRGYDARVGTVDALPFDAGSFDIVVLKHVLEHTATPAHALGELRRVLADRGVVLVAVPDVRYWKGDTRRRTYRYYRPDDLGAQHHVYYSVHTLTQLLEANGFEVRFQSKAVYREHCAARSLLHGLWERARFAALSAWVSAARALRMQREVYLLATKLD